MQANRSEPLLNPVDRPGGLFLRLAFYMSRRLYGRVIAPLRYFYARKPGLLRISLRMNRAAEKLSLEPTLCSLITIYAAFQAGCRFCQDFGMALAVKAGLGDLKFQALAADDLSVFTEREQAALMFTRAIMRSQDGHADAPPALRDQFTDTEIVEIVYLIAMERYYNTISMGLGLNSDDLAPRLHAETRTTGRPGESAVKIA
ncbi:MAG: carboxymuconolactone decarboxylase family protein [Leptospiraceae bacterium]|nr:carboxymuconolactone decarboxylase family protein [Leptospiraceae bacterium]